MATFLRLCTRRVSVVAASGLSRNVLLHPRFMTSRPSSDQTLDILNQFHSPAGSAIARKKRKIKKREQPRQSHDVMSSSTSWSKAHLYVDVATTLRSPPGTFTRNQMFEIWCKNFPISHTSEEEKLRRFKLFNYFLDHEIKNKYHSNHNSTPTEISSGPYEETITGGKEEEERELVKQTSDVKSCESDDDNTPILKEVSDGAVPNETSSPSDQTEVEDRETMTGEKEEARDQLVRQTPDAKYWDRVVVDNTPILMEVSDGAAANETFSPDKTETRNRETWTGEKEEEAKAREDVKQSSDWYNCGSFAFARNGILLLLLYALLTNEGPARATFLFLGVTAYLVMLRLFWIWWW